MAGRAHCHMVVVAPEADFVTGLDPELVRQLLRDADLPFGTDAMSHTSEYDFGGPFRCGDRAALCGRPNRPQWVARGPDLR